MVERDFRKGKEPPIPTAPPKGNILKNITIFHENIFKGTSINFLLDLNIVIDAALPLDCSFWCFTYNREQKKNRLLEIE